ncbi:interleukin-12 receptor subunit beta-2 isoform X2 [Coregonus clupeaformis]|uniref:interleukin-12 receptor subunit beta-2 isoform X2 n=1 Tax=Coregonus clupeaformis TaxID=59861 RepID=UPI001E1C8F2E|nr:interleukin-12 receptor subunit beta-2 isoform X2 [Coregonus clupeaformis]
MAWPRVPCLLLILLLLLQTCLPQPGPPSPPSVPQCHIPYTEGQQAGIHCFWEPGQDPQIPTSYRLRWNSTEGGSGFVECTNVSGVIPRDLYSSYSYMTVLVRAENQHGSAKSKTAEFNTGDIKKPPTPEITHHCPQPLDIYWTLQCNDLGSSDQHCDCPQPLEIYWTLQCNDLGSSDQHCEVQYRTQDQQGWTQEDQLLSNFLLLTPRPYTVYEFQVRCACDGPEALMSDWSSVYTAQSSESAPVKALDVWSDCGVTSELSQCALMWKEMPTWLVQGKVLGYVVTLSHSNGTVEVVNMSTSEPGGLFVCQEKRCRFTPSLQGVSGVDVSVYNSQGATKPAPLALPTLGLQVPELSFTVNLDILSLNVSWSLPPQPIENMQEYVVQYKQVGHPPTQGFDWIKVHQKNTSIILRGDFEKHTAYNVSLFAVFINSSCLLGSTIGYSLHGLPPKVPEFNVQQIADSNVTLSWQHISLTQRKGLILLYQLVLNNFTVYNVSADQSSFHLLGLTPGHHQVWIRAGTKAGLGPSETISFSTKNSHGYLRYLLPLILILIMLPLVIILSIQMKTCFLVPEWCCEKGPDPSNSNLFQQMKLQFNSSLTAICSPLESNPKISELEVVENPFWDAKACPRKRSSPDGQTEGMLGEESTHTRTDTESGSLSEDDPFVSDYEKHFMPMDV